MKAASTARACGLSTNGPLKEPGPFDSMFCDEAPSAVAIEYPFARRKTFVSRLEDGHAVGEGAQEALDHERVEDAARTSEPAAIARTSSQADGQLMGASSIWAMTSPVTAPAANS